MNAPKTADALETSLANIEAFTRQINAGDGSLGKLLKDDRFARSLTLAMANIDTPARKLNSGELITDPELYNRLYSATERLDQLVARLNSGEREPQDSC